jgi:hypothetical protein
MIRACFVPAGWLSEEFCCGVAFGLFRRDTGLMMLLALTNDKAACVEPISPIDPKIHGFSFVGRPAPASP